jgi:radical SAM protein with 4Fe4S-binding SPASM domain
LLHEGRELGVEKVAFTGGEPLLVSYLPDAIRLAASLGIHTSIYTCGAVDGDLTPLSFAYASQLADAGLRRFIFSVYSHSPKVHNAITRYGSFDATVAAIKNALRTNVPAEVHFVAMRRNFRDLPQLVKTASGWGVDRVSILRFVAHGRGVNIAERDDLGPDEMRELRDMIVDARVSHPNMTIRAGSPLNILGIGHTPCDAAQDVLVINHRGEIFPCDAFKNVRYNEPRYGTILNNSLKDVWEHSEYLNRVRSELAAGPSLQCGGCEEFEGCRSGCLAQKVIRDGWAGVSNADPACLVQISGITALAKADDAAVVHVH